MQRQIAVRRIDHVSLISARPARAAQFYIDLLGLHPTDGSTGDSGPAPQGVCVGTETGALFTITQVVDGPAGELGIGTVHHVALTVPSLDGLLKWKRWLQGKGILVYGPYDQQAYQDIILADPDGVILELATRGPGWHAVQDGRDVYSPPKESMAPFRNEELIRLRTWPHPVTQIEPDMALQGFHHIATIVSSLVETDRFYREVLGLELVRKSLDPDDPEVEQWYWGIDGGRPGTLITAFPIGHEQEGAKPLYGRPGVGVVDRFALEVDRDDDARRSWSASKVGRELKVAAHSLPQPAAASVRSPDGQVVDLVAAAVDKE
jgi:catechol 2,3-dioxygenase-like lactoylglutathione lyase family enzyme